MKILIAGAGGVGGYYGGMLAKAGHDVFFVARGAHLDAMAKNGLTVKSINGDFTIPVKCGEDGRAFSVADLVIVCVKSYDTSSTTDLYKMNVGAQTAILSLQNGIDNETVLAGAFGEKALIGGISFIGSRVEKPGVILHTAFGHISIGELFDIVSDRILTIADAFAKASVKCRTSENIKRDIYGKMVWNVGFNAICTILDCDARTLLLFDETKNLVKSAMEEWIKVAVADGVALTPDMANKNIEVTLKGGEVIPSMLVDRRKGRKTEIDTFNGKVVELGKKYKISTPVNATVTGLVRFQNSSVPQ